MFDSHGERVRIGDVVELWRHRKGRVVCVLDEAQFSSAYPASDWAHLKTGALIEADDGSIFHYEEPD